MLEAMGEEVRRRAFALTAEAAREVLSGRTRHHPGWLQDRHLLRGFLLALPLLLVGAPIVLSFAGPAWLSHHDLRPALRLGLPLSIAVNALWFFLAARSRAREHGR